MDRQKEMEQTAVHSQDGSTISPIKPEVRAEDWADMPEQKSFLADFRSLDEDDGVRRMDFFRYVRAMQLPNPTFVEMTADTNRYVTELIISGHVTPWEALRAGESAVHTPEGWKLGKYTDYTFDDQGNEGICIPDAWGMAERLRDIYPDRDIPGPEDMQIRPVLSEQAVVHSQAELDAVPADYAGQIVIDSHGRETIQLSRAYAMPVQVTGGSWVEVCRDSRVEAQDSSWIAASGRSTVEAHDQSQVERRRDMPAMDNASIMERFSQFSAQGGDGALTGPDRTAQTGGPAQKRSVKERLRQIAGQIARAAPHRGRDARQR